MFSTPANPFIQLRYKGISIQPAARYGCSRAKDVRQEDENPAHRRRPRFQHSSCAQTAVSVPKFCGERTNMQPAVPVLKLYPDSCFGTKVLRRESENPAGRWRTKQESPKKTRAVSNLTWTLVGSAICVGKQKAHFNLPGVRVAFLEPA